MLFTTESDSCSPPFLCLLTYFGSLLVVFLLWWNTITIISYSLFELKFKSPSQWGSSSRQQTQQLEQGAEGFYPEPQAKAENELDMVQGLKFPKPAPRDILPPADHTFYTHTHSFANGDQGPDAGDCGDTVIPALQRRTESCSVLRWWWVLRWWRLTV